MSLQSLRRLDGNGCPRGLKAEQITPLYANGRDRRYVYDAVSSDRVYQKGRSHLEAIKVLTECSSNGYLDPALTMKFIECLGIYPAGRIVELNSGKVAMVAEANPKAKLKPKIMMLRDSDQAACDPFIVDLSMVGLKEDGQQYTVKKVLHPDECDIDLLKYYKNGLLQKGWEEPEA